MSDARRIRETLERITRLGPDFGTFMRPAIWASSWHASDSATTRTRAMSKRRARCSPRATTKRRCAAVGALLRLDLTAGLPGLDVPTLVVVGTADALTPPRDSRRIAELVPGARLVEYPGAGHMLMFERTAEVDG